MKSYPYSHGAACRLFSEKTKEVRLDLVVHTIVSKVF